jgi:hypothetical protein
MGKRNIPFHQGLTLLGPEDNCMGIAAQLLRLKIE